VAAYSIYSKPISIKNIYTWGQNDSFGMAPGLWAGRWGTEGSVIRNELNIFGLNIIELTELMMLKDGK
jgi:hypothetical protein